MRRWVWGLALAMVLSVNGALHTPVYADEKTALNGTLTTTIEFEKGSVDQAKHWIDSTVELAKEDMENAMKDASKEEKKQLKKALKELKKTNSNTLLTKRPDGSAEMKNILPGVEIRVGGKKATTRHNGKFTIPQVPLGKHVMRITTEGKLIRELDVVVKRGQPRMDIDLQIYEKQFQENVNRMHQAMGHHHPDSATVQGTATYPELKEGQLVGKGEGGWESSPIRRRANRKTSSVAIKPTVTNPPLENAPLTLPERRNGSRTLGDFRPIYPTAPVPSCWVSFITNPLLSLDGIT